MSFFFLFSCIFLFLLLPFLLQHVRHYGFLGLSKNLIVYHEHFSRKYGLLLNGSVVFHLKMCHNLLNYTSMDKLLDCFQHSAVRKNALAHKILCDLGNIFLDYGKYISLHGLPGHRLFLYLRFSQIILYKNYRFTLHQQCISMPLLPHPYQSWRLGIFNILNNMRGKIILKIKK